MTFTNDMLVTGVVNSEIELGAVQVKAEAETNVNPTTFGTDSTTGTENEGEVDGARFPVTDVVGASIINTTIGVIGNVVIRIEASHIHTKLETTFKEDERYRLETAQKGNFKQQLGKAVFEFGSATSEILGSFVSLGEVTNGEVHFRCDVNHGHDLNMQGTTHIYVNLAKAISITDTDSETTTNADRAIR